ncbi:MAG TPA: hypothetical protein VE967_04500 [Gemmatimonadaceae bacterium]|nr:hypothetical protein [Gemmatimonadaceae bacterium]
MNSIRTSFTAVVLIAAALVACQGDDKKATAAAAAADDSLMAASSAKALANRRRIADSVVHAAPETRSVAQQLGAERYDEADADLTAAVMRESAKTRDCYTNTVRDMDPDLTVVLYVLVNFGAAGWDLVRVEKSTQSSPAGGTVVACLNYRAKKEWNLPTKNIRAGAHLVKIVYTPDSAKVAAKK